MEMRNTLAAIRAIVDDETEPCVVEALLLGNLLRCVNQVTKKGFIGNRTFRDAGNFLFRDDQDMDGRLGLDVVESQAEIVFVGDPGGNFPGDDFREYRAHKLY